jgi:uncharacterized heparinase superfamily protein
MNIFILDTDIRKCAEQHVDKHVIKMILESAQMLCSAVNLSGGDSPYKTTHKNHPCTVWVRESLSNWCWLRDLTLALNEEYCYRYDKTIDHKSAAIVKKIKEPNINDIGLTEFAQAMPEQYKNEDVVKAYRNYYIGEKSNIAKWKKRERPEWYI